METRTTVCIVVKLLKPTIADSLLRLYWATRQPTNHRLPPVYSFSTDNDDYNDKEYDDYEKLHSKNLMSLSWARNSLFFFLATKRGCLQNHRLLRIHTLLICEAYPKYNVGEKAAAGLFAIINNISGGTAGTIDDDSRRANEWVGEDEHSNRQKYGLCLSFLQY